MEKEGRRAFRMFLMSLGFVILGVFFIATPSWPLGIMSLYAATFCFWQGFVSKGRMARIHAENEWWRLAERGVKLRPLHPCCVEYDKTGFLHEEPRCTRDRARDRKPQPRTPEDWARIDKVWAEMIEHFHGECGEEK